MQDLFDVYRDLPGGQGQTKVAGAENLSYEQALTYCKHSGLDIMNLAIRRSEPSGVCPAPASEFTEAQEELIEILIKAGFGYAKFAQSVKASGRCSLKQAAVMRNMVGQLHAPNSI